jgi:hypothetical protein
VTRSRSWVFCVAVNGLLVASGSSCSGPRSDSVASSPSESPTLAECSDALDYGIRLIDDASASSEAQRASLDLETGRKRMAQMAERCVRELKRSDVQCIRAARSAKSVFGCRPFSDAIARVRDASPRRLEAETNINSIWIGAQTYYDRHGRFPPDVGPTPPLEALCRAGSTATRVWDGTWLELGFSAKGSSFSYEVSTGTDKNGPTFVVRAYGDADCNGTYAVFERTGYFDHQGILAPGKIRGVNEGE